MTVGAAHCKTASSARQASVWALWGSPVLGGLVLGGARGTLLIATGCAPTLPGVWTEPHGAPPVRLSRPGRQHAGGRPRTCGSQPRGACGSQPRGTCGSQPHAPDPACPVCAFLRFKSRFYFIPCYRSCSLTREGKARTCLDFLCVRETRCHGTQRTLFKPFAKRQGHGDRRAACPPVLLPRPRGWQLSQRGAGCFCLREVRLRSSLCVPQGGATEVR